MSFLIITDSSAGFSEQEIQELSPYVRVLPFEIIVDDDICYSDDPTSLPREKFLEVMRQENVRTSQTAIGVFEKAFTEGLKQADEVLCLLFTTTLSGQHNSAAALAEKPAFKGKVTVYDTRALGCVLKRMVWAAVEGIKNNQKIADIIPALKSISQSYKLLFLVGDVKQLEKGGRVSPMVTNFLKVFNLYPTLEFANGDVKRHSIYRTFKKALKATAAELSEYGEIESVYFYPPEFDPVNRPKVNNFLQKTDFKKMITIDPPNLLLAHLGTKSLGFCAFYKKGLSHES